MDNSDYLIARCTRFHVRHDTLLGNQDSSCALQKVAWSERKCHFECSSWHGNQWRTHVLFQRASSSHSTVFVWSCTNVHLREYQQGTGLSVRLEDDQGQLLDSIYNWRIFKVTSIHAFNASQCGAFTATNEAIQARRNRKAGSKCRAKQKIVNWV